MTEIIKNIEEVLPTFEIIDNKAIQINKKKFKLVGEWCPHKNCGNDLKNDFYSYPEDGACSCGVHKHHVHCIHGYIIQTG